MKNISKYHGVFPAFYACYDEQGEISPERTAALTEHLIRKGINGLYVGGSSGECIYQSVQDRKTTLESVMETAKGKIPIIAHVGCNNTRDSQELAAHAESLGVDAIASIPPIYFHLPEYAIEKYWNDISSAAPHTDFIIYNIPQLAGVALTIPLLRNMLKNPNVAGVKNSSVSVQDILTFKIEGGEDFVVFNGPDEQFVGGRTMGAVAGIGGTYAVMPELFLKANELVENGKIAEARQVQRDIDMIISAMCSCYGNLYAVMKKILKLRDNLDIGGVRRPLPPIRADDTEKINTCVDLIDRAMQKASGL